MQEVLDTIAETHMEEHVITVGMQSNPYPYIWQADLYVQPSRVESFGLTIMEALILGKNVISTATLGASEILVEREFGVLCDEDASAIAEAVESCLADGEVNLDHVADELINKNRMLMKKLEALL